MPTPTYLGSTSGASAYRSRVSSVTVAYTVPSTANFAIALCMANSGASSGIGYPTFSINGVNAANYYQNNRGAAKRYQISYLANPPTGSRNLVLSTAAVSAFAFGVAFFSGVDISSPIVSYTTASYSDIYTSPALSLASAPNYFLWSSADQNRWQSDGYGGQGYASAPWTTYVQGKDGYCWNGDSDDPSDWLTHASIGGRAGATGSQSVQWNYPYMGSPLVFLCNLRGTSSPRGSAQTIFIF